MGLVGDGGGGIEGRLRQLEEIVSTAPDFIAQCDRAGTVLFMNRAPAGHSITGIVGASLEHLMDESGRPAFRAALARVVAGGGLDGFEAVGCGSGRYYDFRLSPVIEDARVVSVVLICHDITERKQLAEDLSRSEARFRALVEASFHGLAVSIGGAIVACNEALATMTGYSRAELIGKMPASMCAPASVAEIAARIRAGDEGPYEISMIHRDGQTMPVEVMARNIEWDGGPARVVGFRDLTAQRQAEAERRRLEEQMHNAQRLETLGVLASGIAHDFNNLLQIIQIEADLLARGAASGDLSGVAGRILHATQRAAELTGQMLVYGGQLPERIVPIDLAGLVREMAELLRVTVTRTAELIVSAEAEGPFVEGSPSQLRQVILNLVVNASEALAEAGGRVELSLHRTSPGPDARARAVLDAAGDCREFVTLEVSDSGAGIDPAIQARIFDPFYSTKSQGRGLGLASVLGIVRSHRGVMEVDNLPGRGTRMRVHLPAYAGPGTPVPDAVRAAAPKVALHGKGLLLIADDEPAIRAAIGHLAELAGFEVVTASNGREALEVIARRGDVLRAALVDLAMPEVTGDRVLAIARAERPGLPLILMSGHLEGAAALAALDDRAPR